jgi:bacterial/archaeal transporter family protein
MERWYLLTLLALVLFSLGSFLGKVASIKDIPYRVYFFEGIGTLTVFTTFVIYNRSHIFNNFSVNYPGLLMGLSWGIGTVLFIVALKSAKLSIIVPLSAVYPALTVVLALVFLGEKLGPREIGGVVLAVISAALLAK